MTAAMASTTGMIMNRPGPLTLDSLPARRMTKRSQLLAIFNENSTSTARTPTMSSDFQAGNEQQRADDGEHDGNE